MCRRLLTALPLAILACCAASPPNDFRFAVLGDRTGGAVPGVYERAWIEVAGLDPSFVINVGDSIEGGRDTVIEGSGWISSVFSPVHAISFLLHSG